jgi:hypothetical protein
MYNGIRVLIKHKSVMNMSVIKAGQKDNVGDSGTTHTDFQICVGK